MTGSVKQMIWSVGLCWPLDMCEARFEMMSEDGSRTPLRGGTVSDRAIIIPLPLATIQSADRDLDRLREALDPETLRSGVDLGYSRLR